MNVKLTRVTENPVGAIEEAASNCYNSEPTEDGRITKECIKAGHTSVTEFANFTFHIEGASRSLLAQLTRHRMASFAVQSQRYVDMNNFSFVIPPTILDDADAQDRFYHIMTLIGDSYNELQKLGIPDEDARYVLPNACETVIEFTMNLRSLMNFMNERLCSRAQWEIRELAQKMRDLIVKQYPEFKPYLVPKCEKHIGFPFCTESKCCGRHLKLKDVYRKVKANENLCCNER